MPDRLFYPIAAAATLGMVFLALVWPQGSGARSPAPFGHEVMPVMQTPAATPAKK